MLFDIIIRSTAAFGGTPFRLKKCTALGSAGTGAAAGAAAGMFMLFAFCFYISILTLFQV